MKDFKNRQITLLVLFVSSLPAKMKGGILMPQGTSIIIKFEESTEQTVGSITKIVGLVPARFFCVDHRFC